MGVLSNFIIKNPGEFKRSPTPFFSILTKIPEIQKSINYPFGQNSPFDFLRKNNGSIIFYGTNISSNTFLHYIEALNNNGPLYRYEKKFEGKRRDYKLTLSRALSDSDVERQRSFASVKRAREKQIKGVNSEFLAKKIKVSQKSIETKKTVLNKIQNQKRDLLITLGAGDITLLGPKILRYINENK